MNPGVLTVYLGNSGWESEKRRREAKNQKVKAEGTVSKLNRNISLLHDRTFSLNFFVKFNWQGDAVPGMTSMLNCMGCLSEN